MEKSIRSLAFYAGVSLLAASFLWCVVGPYLTARNFIPVDSEIDGYCFCFPSVVFGCALCIAGLPRTFLAQGSCFFLSVGVFFLVIVTLTSLSDREFTYWKLTWISRPEWERMKSDLQAIGEKALLEKEAEITLPGHRVPAAFRKLGLSADGFFGGVESGQQDVTHTNEIVYLLCGGRSRTWGLFIGPKTYVNERWPNFSCFPVAQNAYFVVGVHD